MLIGLEDLPPGWTMLDRRRWRTGISTELWAIRARQLGGVTAWRSFAAPSKRQWLWTQATPLASDDDAAAALAVFLDLGLKNLRARVVVTSTQPGPDLRLPGIVVRTVEQLTTGPKGAGTVRYVVWAHARVLSVLCGSGDDWLWSRLDTLARAQTERIDTIVST